MKREMRERVAVTILDQLGIHIPRLDVRVYRARHIFVLTSPQQCALIFSLEQWILSLANELLGAIANAPTKALS